MKNLIGPILLSFVLSSCASVKVEEFGTNIPKSGNCKVEIFASEKEVKREFEVVCTLDSKTGNSLWDKRTAEAAIENAKSKACACGADAIVVTSSGRTKLKFYSYRRGVASMKGIKYL